MIGILKNIWHRRSSVAYLNYLRSKGVKIGKRCILRSPGSTRIDTQRPELIRK